MLGIERARFDVALAPYSYRYWALNAVGTALGINGQHPIYLIDIARKQNTALQILPEGQVSGTSRTKRRMVCVVYSFEVSVHMPEQRTLRPGPV